MLWQNNLRTMPQVTIDTSANIEDAKAVTIIGAASNVLAKAAGVPTEHVHINLKRNQLMTWGSKLGGVDGNPHTAQVRIVVSQALTAANKQAIVTGVGKLLAQHAPPASTQFYFVTAAVEDLAIDGLLLPDLIARDASTPAAAAAPAKESKGAAQQAKQTPEEKKAKEAAKDAEKLRLKIIKEGGKKGVEIEGASDMGEHLPQHLPPSAPPSTPPSAPSSAHPPSAPPPAPPSAPPSAPPPKPPFAPSYGTSPLFPTYVADYLADV